MPAKKRNAAAVYELPAILEQGAARPLAPVDDAPFFPAEELIFDSFAGGGGASTGIEIALGRSPDAAFNHDIEAIRMHAANHPSTKHYVADIWSIDPREVARSFGGRPVGLLWASPDCTHHSKARGGKPRSNKRRGLADVVLQWAEALRPRVIALENVEEFRQWGPLLDDGTPDPTKKGADFERWTQALQALGYTVEHRELRACDYGAPTSRKRLFIIARRDGGAVNWPAPTHGDGPGMIPFLTAADCIDWSIPCTSIFGRDKPLVEKTLARIARGIMKYVVEPAQKGALPFLIPLTHTGVRVHGLDEPVRTITCAPRGEHALISPSLVQVGFGERKGQAPRTLDIRAPLGTIVAQGTKHALVTAFLAKHYGGHTTPGIPLSGPTSTITTQDHHALVSANLLTLRNNCDGKAANDTVPTICASGQHIGLVTAFLLKYYGNSEVGQGVDRPIDTVTTRDRFGLVVVDGAVVVEIEGCRYIIADIGMRMLTPRELARAQGFPADYELDTPSGLTKTAQVRMIGNSVCPPIAAAIIRANASPPTPARLRKAA